MNPLGLAAPASVVDRLALSQLVTDAFAGLPLPERYALAWVLSPVFSARNRLTSATSELLAKPVARVLAFAEGGEPRSSSGVRPSPAVTASGWPTRARVKGPRHGPSAGCTRSGNAWTGGRALTSTTARSRRACTGRRSSGWWTSKIRWRWWGWRRWRRGWGCLDGRPRAGAADHLAAKRGPMRLV